MGVSRSDGLELVITVSVRMMRLVLAFPVLSKEEAAGEVSRLVRLVKAYRRGAITEDMKYELWVLLGMVPVASLSFQSADRLRRELLP